MGFSTLEDPAGKPVTAKGTAEGAAVVEAEFAMAQLLDQTPIDATPGLPVRTVPNRVTAAKTAAGSPAAALVVRAGPCWLYDIFVSNQTNTACYVTLFDTITAPAHGGPATERKIVGRRIGKKVGTDPLNFKEDFPGLYFATGCVIVLEMAENDATVNRTGAPNCAMGASFIPAT